MRRLSSRNSKGSFLSTESKKSKGSIPLSVFKYCKRMGIWVVVSALGNVTTQAAALVLYWWNEKWASDAWGLGFRRNYAVAIILMLGACTSLIAALKGAFMVYVCRGSIYKLCSATD